MKWTELISRCALFIDAPKVMIDKLLKEAEKELAIQCDIFEDEFEFEYAISPSTNYIDLPTNFKSIISVRFNGVELSAIDETERSLDGDNNMLTSSPNHYYIMNNTLFFNSIPSKSDKVLIIYNSTLEYEGETNKNYPILNYTNTGASAVKTFYKDKEETISNSITVYGKILVETQHDYDFYGKTASLKFPGSNTVNSLGRIYYADTPTSESTRRGGNSPNTSPVKEFWCITNFITMYETKGAVLQVNQYLEGPKIPEQYHRVLCDYAIALSSAKNNPEMYGRHMEIWEGNLVNIKEQASDRELIHSIKSVI